MKFAIPDTIYLLDPCGENFHDGRCCQCGDAVGFCEADDVLCCTDRQTATDVEYRRVGTMPEKLQALRREINTQVIALLQAYKPIDPVLPTQDISVAVAEITDRCENEYWGDHTITAILASVLMYIGLAIDAAVGEPLR